MALGQYSLTENLSMAASMSPWNRVSVYPLPTSTDGLLEPLLRTTLHDLAQTYRAEVAIWVRLEGFPHEMRVYLLGQSWQLEEEALAASEDGIQGVALSSYPGWLMDFEDHAQVSELSTGDLLVPMLCPALRGLESDDEVAPQALVPLVLQLRRVPAAIPATPLLTPEQTFAPAIARWSEAEVQDLKESVRNLAICFQQATLQERLGWLRQQSALVGRITHLLNSSLNPDVVLHQILAELGQGYESACCLMLDLRDTAQVSLSAHWENGATSSPPDLSPLTPKLWESLTEQFLQDGASYVILQAEDAEIESALCETLEVPALLLVPVFFKTEFFGVLTLAMEAERPSFRVEELQTLYQVADHAAIALNQIFSVPDVTRQGDRPDPLNEWRDALTHLPNRDALDQELMRLSHATLWPTQADFSVLLADIDYFKLINDNYGNHAGDKVLQALGQRLQKQLRHGTLMYRYDGEEFLILLRRTPLNAAADVAERLRATVQQHPIETSAGLVTVTVSFGVAQRDRTRDSDAYAVVERAEQALLEAKRQGRNRIKVL
ncbi:sensor domain-containing diguanylate cyclase [Leptolyngbya sp. PL-A3]|uniref:sensor domain-containing diguanylate cyclase n=1 Tax=Leptolyngbya sp. PL-A3 TaxID=2933911 RepID=UPI0032982574